MLQTLLSGLADGSIYGLVALSFGVIFYVTRVINFAQGQVAMIAVMVTAVTAGDGWPIGIAILVGVLAATIISVIIYLVAVRPVLALDRFSYAWLVTTLGIALLLENGAAILWGTTSRPFPSLLNNSNFKIGSATLTFQQVLSIVVVLLLAGVVEFIRRRTLIGRLGVATAADPEIASAVGINTTMVAIGAFVLAGLIVAIAGVLVGPRTFGNAYLGETYGNDGFVALMIAGTRWPVGGVFGGLLLGVLEQGAVAWINPEAAGWVPLVAVVLVLLIMPQGLFGGGTPFSFARRSLRKLYLAKVGKS
jgi:branched-chain amino acid transport system permease protein